MKFLTILRYGVIAVSIMLGAFSLNVTAQEIGRDAIYSRFEEYYPDTSPEKIREVLDAFAQHLKANRSLRALLISYGGKQSCRNEALLRARLATRYLLKMHGISSSRSTILNGGYREDWVVELWVGSSGATAPSPTRTINKKQVTISGKCKFRALDGNL
ncbi:MAG TPA: hypothetical protein VF088_17360 [Pyrinomonadaceae bacterium]